MKSRSRGPKLDHLMFVQRRKPAQAQVSASIACKMTISKVSKFHPKRKLTEHNKTETAAMELFGDMDGTTNKSLSQCGQGNKHFKFKVSRNDWAGGRLYPSSKCPETEKCCLGTQPNAEPIWLVQGQNSLLEPKYGCEISKSRKSHAASSHDND